MDAYVVVRQENAFNLIYLLHVQCIIGTIVSSIMKA